MQSSMDNVTIRPYRQQDLKELTRLFTQWTGMDHPDEAGMAESVARAHKNPMNSTLVAVDASGRLVGYLFVGVCDYVGVPRFLEVIQILVDERSRGKGIGGALLDFAETFALKQGIHEVRLHSRVILPKAHAFYEKHGYTCFKTSKFFVKKH